MNDKQKKRKEEEVYGTGVVIDSLPNLMFKVLLDEPDPYTDKKEVIAYLGGKMKYYRIRVLVGDKVTVLLDKYGSRARLTRRH